MKHLMIDNCSLRHLIETHGYSKYIIELEDMINANHIQLYTHDKILNEWNKHKNKWRHDKERKIKHFNSSKITTNNTSLININNQSTFTHLDEQIRKLDILLSKAIEIPTPDGIRNEVAFRMANNLYPFKNKKDSLNDWEIFGSYANHCENYKITQLIFISYNHTDFSDELDINKKIHSSLSDRFKKVNIIYYKQISDFFDEINNNNYLPAHLIEYNIIKSIKYSFPATIKSNVLDALFNLYHKLYREINFIPTHILSKCFPFSISEKSNVYFGGFRLSYVNDNLVDFVENINIDANNNISFKDDTLVNFIQDYFNKTKFVLRHLTQNLIFSLSSENSRKTVSSHYFIKEECNCYRCCYDRFEILNSLQKINTDNNSNKDKLKQAYIHYQLGNYISANNVYDEILLTALKNDENILYFLAKYNKRHLAVFLQNPMTCKNIDYNLINLLKEIDPVEEAVKLKSYSDYNLLTFIAQEDFFNYTFQKIKDIVGKIVDHYYLQLNGGWSSNQYITTLIEEYAELDSFLNNNYIIYDKYSNYSKLFEMVIEGLFASHAISETQESRLQFFDNYWLNKFIFYGNKKAFKKYFKRYKLKSLKYNNEDINNEPFINIAKNILSCTSDDISEIKRLSDNENDSFNSLFNEYFGNLITLSALLDLSKEMTNEIAINLLSFLKNEIVLYHYEFDSIHYFLERKKKIIDTSILLQYFKFFLHNNKGHDEKSLETIIECFEDNSFVELTNEDFELLLNQSIVLCDKCKSVHSIDILTSLYFKVDEINKTKIANKIIETLNIEFKFDLFFTFSIYGIIQPDLERVNRLLSEYIVPVENKKYKGPFSRRNDFTNTYLDELFNLCFKFDIDTTDVKFEKFKQIHHFYDWLLNMEDFNYENFEVEWVTIHPVTYYYKKMSKSKKLIKYLVNYLDKNSNYSIERTLIQITYFVKE